MKMLIPAAGALTLALALPQLADAQDRGGGHDRGGHDRGGQDRGGGQQRDRGDQGRGGGNDHARGQDVARGQARPDTGRGRDDRGGRNVEQEVRRAVRSADRPDRGPDRGPGDRRDDRPDIRRVDRADIRLPDRRDDRPDVVFFRSAPDRGLIAGCPPGLARKDNGCLPPGQARRIARDYARYDYVWGRSDDYRYRYDDGYLYRYTPQGSLAGWLPALGGALGLGSVWPAQYQYQPVPTYYSRYYRLPDRYDYRYADGVLYGVDPETRAISQVAALLTGQQWSVGQAMPVGYDVYNVPYGYRDRYYDTPDRWYRYNDGYVYQVDPTTRLVQAVVQLLT